MMHQKQWIYLQLCLQLLEENMICQLFFSVLDLMTNGAECVVESIDYRIEKSSRPSHFQIPK